MAQREVKTWIIILTSLVVCIGLFFSYVANLRLYRESYINAMVRGYKLAAGQGILQIEYALKYGKSIDNFYNMDSILKQIADSVPGIDDILLVQSSGNILYALSGKDAVDISVSNLLGKENDPAYIESKEFYYITVPVRNAKGDREASMVISLKRFVLDDEPQGFQKENGVQFLFFSACGIIIIITLLSRTALGFGSRRSRIITAFAVVLLTVLILGAFNGFMAYMTTETLTYSTEKIGDWLCSIVQMDINRVLHKGVPINVIYDLSGWLEKTSSQVPEIKNLYMDADNKVKATLSQAYIQQRKNKTVLYGWIIIFGCAVLQLIAVKGMEKVAAWNRETGSV